MDYVICASPRTASNLLTSALRATSLAGQPHEAFDPPAIRRRGFAPGPDLDVAGYVRALREETTGANGVFGFKLHFHQADFYLFKRGLGLEDVLESPRFVSIARDDALGQAISWERAQQTGQYSSVQQPVRRIEPRYDFAALSRTLTQALRNRRGWAAYFARRRIARLSLSYEGFTADYRGTLLRTLRFLGVAVPADLEVPPPRLQRQADALNQRWRQLYLRDVRHALDARADLSSAGARRRFGTALQSARVLTEHLWRTGRWDEALAILSRLPAPLRS